MLRSEPLLQALFWSLLTIGLYVLGKRIYRRRPSWWASPLVVAPLLLIVAALALHVSYREYIRGTHWLLALLAPATVAFAIPIYEQRALIRRHWPLLILGVLVGSVTAMLSSWGLASLLGLDGTLRLSLLPRSVTTPFAVIVSGDIGGAPALTAVFVHERRDLPARMYMTVGDREVNQEHDMVTDLRRMARSLEGRDYRGLHLQWDVAENETHNSVFPRGLSNGLRYVMEGRD